MGILDRSESRGTYRVRVLAVHTSEGNDQPRIDDAAALRDASWWAGSSHAIADNDPGSLLTPAQGCVPYERASWTLRSGNRWSENIELIGFAKWKRADWLARPKLLDNCARWLADRSKARGIPLVKLTPQQYRAGQSGVIGHHDHTVGYADGTHWDPGPEFPWDVVLDKARAYAGGAPTQEDTVSMQEVIDSWYGPRFKDSRNYAQVIHNIEDLLVALRARVDAAPATSTASVQVDAASVAAALADQPGFLAAVAKAVNDDAARRQAS